LDGRALERAFIQRNRAISVGGRLRDAPCKFVGNAVKIEVFEV